MCAAVVDIGLKVVENLELSLRFLQTPESFGLSKRQSREEYRFCFWLKGKEFLEKVDKLSMLLALVWG